MQHMVLQLRQRGKPALLQEVEQLAFQRRAVVQPEVEAEAPYQRFHQQFQLKFLQLRRRTAAQLLVGAHQCSQTRIRDSSCATSTGLVM